jgi:hypothetical protein
MEVLDRRWRVWEYGKLMHLSRQLTMSPEEYVGRFGHEWSEGGPPLIAHDDPDAPPGLAQWSARVHELLHDLEVRRELRLRFLSAEELAVLDAARAQDD